MKNIPCKYPEKGPMMYEARAARAARREQLAKRRAPGERNARDAATPRPRRKRAAGACESSAALGRRIRSSAAQAAQSAAAALTLAVRRLTAPQTMEYCAELTRQREAARQGAASRTTSSRDTFLYPRGWEESEQEVQADPHAHLTQAEREQLWLLTIEERIHRRRRMEAGYDPDISKGVRRLNVNDGDDESDDEAPPASADASAVPGANRQPREAAAVLAPEPETEAPPPRRYGVVMREAGAADAVAQPASMPPTAPAASPSGGAVEAVEVLRRVFPADHPGVTTMAAWLKEEGVGSASQLRALLQGGQGGGAAALRDIGFRPEWAAATAAGFARAATAAEKAAATMSSQS